jgi:hypothetical protein
MEPLGLVNASISLSRRCLITYTQLLTRNAYINVHLNDGAGLSTIVAQGNIGSNEVQKTYNVTANGTHLMFLTVKGLPI